MPHCLESRTYALSDDEVGPTIWVLGPEESRTDGDGRAK